jgi:hypothetical protein
VDKAGSKEISSGLGWLADMGRVGSKGITSGLCCLAAMAMFSHCPEDSGRD